MIENVINLAVSDTSVLAHISWNMMSLKFHESFSPLYLVSSEYILAKLNKTRPWLSDAFKTGGFGGIDGAKCEVASDDGGWCCSVDWTWGCWSWTCWVWISWGQIAGALSIDWTVGCWGSVCWCCRLFYCRCRFGGCFDCNETDERFRSRFDVEDRGDDIILTRRYFFQFRCWRVVVFKLNSLFSVLLLFSQMVYERKSFEISFFFLITFSHFFRCSLRAIFFFRTFSSALTIDILMFVNIHTLCFLKKTKQI